MCEWSWNSRGHAYLQPFLGCPAQPCVYVSQLKLHKRPFIFLSESVHLIYTEMCWCCYLPCAAMIRNDWRQVLGWLQGPQFVQQEEFRRYICVLPHSCLLWTAAVWYFLQAPALGTCVPCSCFSLIHRPTRCCRGQKCLINEMRSYKWLWWRRGTVESCAFSWLLPCGSWLVMANPFWSQYL